MVIGEWVVEEEGDFPGCLLGVGRVRCCMGEF